ncbi:MAG: HEAT repeat domain-containing protein, partial [Candidatus Omnitrophica bacterium]|nr:HEAT repeat domain-containing protein [Candidatus Omnitrophota bacterium]
ALLEEDRFYAETELCRTLNSESATLAPDFRALVGHLGLARSTIGENGETSYKLLSRARRNSLRIIKTLQELQKEHHYRPKVAELKKIRPLIDAIMDRSSGPESDASAASRTKSLISKLLLKPDGFDWAGEKDTLPDLKGMSLGRTDRWGLIRIVPKKNYQYRWNILGAYEEGWKAVITDSSVTNGVYQITVKLTKGKHPPRTKTFQIGPSRKKLHGNHAEKGNIISVLNITEDAGKQAINKLVSDPEKFQEMMLAGELPDLKGLRIGKLDRAGAVRFYPKKGYLFIWTVLGYRDEGWEGTIINSSIKKGVYQITVKLEKKEKPPIIKIFQIGPSVRVLHGEEEKKDTTIPVVDISEKMGAQVLSGMIGPEWYDAPRSSPDLSGLRIGKTNKHGCVTLTPHENYSIDWPVLGFYGEGWEGTIVQSGYYHGYHQFTVELVKDGEDPVVRVFQIGPRKKILRGNHREKGKTREVLQLIDVQALRQLSDVDGYYEKPGREILAELVADTESFDSMLENKSLPDLRGVYLEKTNKAGRIDLPVKKNFPFPWSVLGRQGEGWHTFITDSSIKNGIYQITVRLVREGEESVERTFQIGPLKRILPGKHEEKGNNITVLDIAEDPGRKVLSRLIYEPVDYFKWKRSGKGHSLTGLRLGKTDEQGVIKLVPKENYEFSWSILGFAERGWDAVVISDHLRDKVIEFTVKLTREGREPVYRTFQISHFRRRLNKTTGKQDYIYARDISDKLGFRVLAKVIAKGTRSRWEKDDKIPDIEGLRMGVTDKYGHVRFNPIRGYTYNWYVLGFREAGWEITGVKSWIAGGFYRFTVDLIKGDKKIRKTFQVGPYTTTLAKGHKGNKKETYAVLKIESIERIKMLAGKEDFYRGRRAGYEGDRVVEITRADEMHRELDARHIWQIIEEAINKLNIRQQKIAEMVLEGMKDRQIAEKGRYTTAEIFEVRTKLRGSLSFLHKELAMFGVATVITPQKNARDEEEVADVRPASPPALAPEEEKKATTMLEINDKTITVKKVPKKGGDELPPGTGTAMKQGTGEVVDDGNAAGKGDKPRTPGSSLRSKVSTFIGLLAGALILLPGKLHAATNELVSGGINLAQPISPQNSMWVSAILIAIYGAITITCGIWTFRQVFHHARRIWRKMDEKKVQHEEKVRKKELHFKYARERWSGDFEVLKIETEEDVEEYLGGDESLMNESNYIKRELGRRDRPDNRSVRFYVVSRFEAPHRRIANGELFERRRVPIGTIRIDRVKGPSISKDVEADVITWRSFYDKYQHLEMPLEYLNIGKIKNVILFCNLTTKKVPEKGKKGYRRSTEEAIPQKPVPVTEAELEKTNIILAHLLPYEDEYSLDGEEFLRPPLRAAGKTELMRFEHKGSAFSKYRERYWQAMKENKHFRWGELCAIGLNLAGQILVGGLTYYIQKASATAAVIVVITFIWGNVVGPALGSFILSRANENNYRQEKADRANAVHIKRGGSSYEKDFEATTKEKKTLMFVSLNRILTLCLHVTIAYIAIVRLDLLAPVGGVSTVEAVFFAVLYFAMCLGQQITSGLWSNQWVRKLDRELHLREKETGRGTGESYWQIMGYGVTWGSVMGLGTFFLTLLAFNIYFPAGITLAISAVAISIVSGFLFHRFGQRQESFMVIDAKDFHEKKKGLYRVRGSNLKIKARSKESHLPPIRYEKDLIIANPQHVELIYPEGANIQGEFIGFDSKNWWRAFLGEIKWLFGRYEEKGPFIEVKDSAHPDIPKVRIYTYGRKYKKEIDIQINKKRSKETGLTVELDEKVETKVVKTRDMLWAISILAIATLFYFFGFFPFVDWIKGFAATPFMVNSLDYLRELLGLGARVTKLVVWPHFVIGGAIATTLSYLFLSSIRRVYSTPLEDYKIYGKEGKKIHKSESKDAKAEIVPARNIKGYLLTKDSIYSEFITEVLEDNPRVASLLHPVLQWHRRGFIKKLLTSIEARIIYDFKHGQKRILGIETIKITRFPIPFFGGRYDKAVVDFYPLDENVYPELRAEDKIPARVRNIFIRSSYASLSRGKEDSTEEALYDYKLVKSSASETEDFYHFRKDRPPLSHMFDQMVLPMRLSRPQRWEEWIGIISNSILMPIFMTTFGLIILNIAAEYFKIQHQLAFLAIPISAVTMMFFYQRCQRRPTEIYNWQERSETWENRGTGTVRGETSAADRNLRKRWARIFFFRIFVAILIITRVFWRELFSVSAIPGTPETLLFVGIWFASLIVGGTMGLYFSAADDRFHRSAISENKDFEEFGLNANWWRFMKPRMIFLIWSALSVTLLFTGLRGFAPKSFIYTMGMIVTVGMVFARTVFVYFGAKDDTLLTIEDKHYNESRLMYTRRGKRKTLTELVFFNGNNEEYMSVRPSLGKELILSRDSEFEAFGEKSRVVISEPAQSELCIFFKEGDIEEDPVYHRWGKLDRHHMYGMRPFKYANEFGRSIEIPRKGRGSLWLYINDGKADYSVEPQPVEEGSREWKKGYRHMLVIRKAKDRAPPFFLRWLNKKRIIFISALIATFFAYLIDLSLGFPVIGKFLLLPLSVKISGLVLLAAGIVRVCFSSTGKIMQKEMEKLGETGPVTNPEEISNEEGTTMKQGTGESDPTTTHDAIRTTQHETAGLPAEALAKAGTAEDMSLDEAYSFLLKHPFLNESDLELSRKTAEGILKYPIDRIMVVGDGLWSLVFLLALTGKDVAFVEVDADKIEITKRYLEDRREYLRGALQITTVCGGIGVLDIEKSDIKPHSYDLITFIDLIGGFPNGDPRKWLLKAQELLKPEGYLLVDEDHSDIIKHFPEIFPNHELVADGMIFFGEYNGNDGKNRLYRVVNSDASGEKETVADTADLSADLSAVALAKAETTEATPEESDPTTTNNEQRTTNDETGTTMKQGTGEVDPGGMDHTGEEISNRPAEFTPASFDQKAYFTLHPLTGVIFIDDIKNQRGATAARALRRKVRRTGILYAEHEAYAPDPFRSNEADSDIYDNFPEKNKSYHWMIFGGLLSVCIGKQVLDVMDRIARGPDSTTTYITLPLTAITTGILKNSNREKHNLPHKLVEYLSALSRGDKSLQKSFRLMFNYDWQLLEKGRRKKRPIFEVGNIKLVIMKDGQELCIVNPKGRKIVVLHFLTENVEDIILSPKVVVDDAGAADEGTPMKQGTGESDPTSTNDEQRTTNDETAGTADMKDELTIRQKPSSHDMPKEKSLASSVLSTLLKLTPLANIFTLYWTKKFFETEDWQEQTQAFNLLLLYKDSAIPHVCRFLRKAENRAKLTGYTQMRAIDVLENQNEKNAERTLDTLLEIMIDRTIHAPYSDPEVRHYAFTKAKEIYEQVSQDAKDEFLRRIEEAYFKGKHGDSTGKEFNSLLLGHWIAALRGVKVTDYVLRTLVNADDKEVAIAAVRLLDNIDPKEMFETIKSIALNKVKIEGTDRLYSVVYTGARQFAIHALDQLNTEEAIDVILQIASDKEAEWDYDVWGFAVFTLSESTNPRVREYLVKVISQEVVTPNAALTVSEGDQIRAVAKTEIPDPKVIENAIESLNKMNTPESRRSLIMLAQESAKKARKNNNDWKIIKYAARALHDIRSEEKEELRGKCEDLIALLVRIVSGEEKRENHDEVLFAVEALGKIQSEDPDGALFDFISKLIEKKEKAPGEWRLVQTGLVALKEMGSKKFIELALKIITFPEALEFEEFIEYADARHYAIMFLAEIDPEDPRVEEIVDLLIGIFTETRLGVTDSHSEMYGLSVLDKLGTQKARSYVEGVAFGEEKCVYPQTRDHAISILNKSKHKKTYRTELLRSVSLGEDYTPEPGTSIDHVLEVLLKTLEIERKTEHDWKAIENTIIYLGETKTEREDVFDILTEIISGKVQIGGKVIEVSKAEAICKAIQALTEIGSQEAVEVFLHKAEEIIEQDERERDDWEVLQSLIDAFWKMRVKEAAGILKRVVFMGSKDNDNAELVIGARDHAIDALHEIMGLGAFNLGEVSDFAEVSLAREIPYSTEDLDALKDMGILTSEENQLLAKKPTTPELFSCHGRSMWRYINKRCYWIKGSGSGRETRKNGIAFGKKGDNDIQGGLTYSQARHMSYYAYLFNYWLDIARETSDPVVLTADQHSDEANPFIRNAGLFYLKSIPGTDEDGQTQNIPIEKAVERIGYVNQSKDPMVLYVYSSKMPYRWEEVIGADLDSYVWKPYLEEVNQDKKKLLFTAIANFAKAVHIAHDIIGVVLHNQHGTVFSGHNVNVFGEIFDYDTVTSNPVNLSNKKNDITEALNLLKALAKKLDIEEEDVNVEEVFRSILAAEDTGTAMKQGTGESDDSAGAVKRLKKQEKRFIKKYGPKAAGDESKNEFDRISPQHRSVLEKHIHESFDTYIRKPGRKTQVIADVSSAGWHVAEGIAERYKNVEVEDLSDGPNSLDGAVCNFGLTSLTLNERGEFLKELRAALKPGAKAVFLVHHPKAVIKRRFGGRKVLYKDRVELGRLFRLYGFKVHMARVLRSEKDVLGYGVVVEKRDEARYLQQLWGRSFSIFKVMAPTILDVLFSEKRTPREQAGLILMLLRKGWYLARYVKARRWALDSETIAFLLDELLEIQKEGRVQRTLWFGIREILERRPKIALETSVQRLLRTHNSEEKMKLINLIRDRSLNALKNRNENEAVVHELIRLLDTKDDSLRAEVYDALASADHVIIPKTFFRMLRSEDGFTDEEKLKILNVLLKHFDEDIHRVVKIFSSVWRNLKPGGQTKETLLQKIYKKLDDKDSGVRRCAFEVLGNVGNVSSVGKVLESVRKRGLRRICPEALVALFKLSKERRVLAEREEEIIAPFLRALKDGSDETRELVCSLLGRIYSAKTGPERMRRTVADRLVDMAGDSNVRVQVGAADALARMKDERAFDVMISLLNNTENSYVIDRIIEGLGKLGDKKAIPHLVKVMADEKMNSGETFTFTKAVIRLGRLQRKDKLWKILEYPPATARSEKSLGDYLLSIEKEFHQNLKSAGFADHQKAHDLITTIAEFIYYDTDLSYTARYSRGVDAYLFYYYLRELSEELRTRSGKITWKDLKFLDALKESPVEILEEVPVVSLLKGKLASDLEERVRVYRNIGYAKAMARPVPESLLPLLFLEIFLMVKKGYSDKRIRTGISRIVSRLEKEEWIGEYLPLCGWEIEWFLKNWSGTEEIKKRSSELLGQLQILLLLKIGEGGDGTFEAYSLPSKYWKTQSRMIRALAGLGLIPNSPEIYSTSYLPLHFSVNMPKNLASGRVIQEQARNIILPAMFLYTSDNRWAEKTFNSPSAVKGLGADGEGERLEFRPFAIERDQPTGYVDDIFEKVQVLSQALITYFKAQTASELSSFEKTLVKKKIWERYRKEIRGVLEKMGERILQKDHSVEYAEYADFDPNAYYDDIRKVWPTLEDRRRSEFGVELEQILNKYVREIMGLIRKDRAGKAKKRAPPGSSSPDTGIAMK